MMILYNLILYLVFQKVFGMPYYYISRDPSNNLRRYDKHLICEMV